MKKLILLSLVLVGLPFKLNAQLIELHKADEEKAFLNLIEIFLCFILGMIFLTLFISLFKTEPSILYYKFEFVNENESNVNKIDVKKYDIEYVSKPVGFLTSATEEIYKITTLEGKKFMINKKNIFSINKVYKNEKK